MTDKERELLLKLAELVVTISENPQPLQVRQIREDVKQLTSSVRADARLPKGFQENK